MADYVTREVARDRLRSACKAGSGLSVVLLLVGLGYAGIAAIIATNVAVPKLVDNALHVIVPTMADPTLSLAECATKAVLLVLAAILSLIMFGKVRRSGEAFRARQLRQLRFVALLLMLLGFLPTVAGNVAKLVFALQAGGSPLTVMSFAVEPMCVVCGIMFFMAARMLVAGAVLQDQEGSMPTDDPYISSPEASFAGMDDLGQVGTATPLSNNYTTTGVDQTIAR